MARDTSRVISANDAAEPPTAVSTSAVVATTGASAIGVTGSAYIYGVKFQVGSAGSAANLNLNNGGTVVKQIYENCDLWLTKTSATSQIVFGSSSLVLQEFIARNCSFKFGATGQFINMQGQVFIDGGSVASGGSTPAAGVFGMSRSNVNVISGFDLSNLSSTVNLVRQVGQSGKIIFRNCKLPASWTGNLLNSAPSGPGFRAEMYNCDSGDTNYRLWIEDYLGSIKQETTLVRTGGASDGATGLSWKMTSSANALYPTMPLVSGEILAWNETVGSSVTATVEILHDSATNLTDAEVWVEAQALTTSGFPLGALINDAKADVLATAADQASSSETWTTTGMTNPNKQKLSVTFTPQEKGPILLRVYLAKPSKTIYVDPVSGAVTTTRQWQIPGGQYINESGSGGGGMLQGNLRGNFQ